MARRAPGWPSRSQPGLALLTHESPRANVLASGMAADRPLCRPNLLSSLQEPAMDIERFDAIVKELSTGASRRRVLAGSLLVRLLTHSPCTDTPDALAKNKKGKG